MMDSGDLLDWLVLNSTKHQVSKFISLESRDVIEKV